MKPDWKDATELDGELIEHLLFMAYLDGWGDRDINDYSDPAKRTKVGLIARRKAKEAIKGKSSWVYT